MIEELTDKEQIELVKKWWHRYGKAALLAIIIGLIVGFGWRYWRQHKISQSENASVIYQHLQNLAAQKQFSKAQILSKELTSNYSDTPYASMAALISARDDVLKNDLKSALAQLRWVIKNSGIASIKQIARLRASRILLEQKQYQLAIKTLETVNDPVYQPLIDSVKGDIYRATGKMKLASRSYRAAQKGFASGGIRDPFLNMKISRQ